MLSKIFGRKRKQAEPEAPSDEDPVIAVPIPPLVTLLVALEQEKGAPLSEVEVLKARDEAVCMTMPRSVAWRVAEQRGYKDFNPENVWVEWQAFLQSGGS